MGAMAVSWAPATPPGCLLSAKPPSNPDGRIVSCGCDNTVRVRSVPVRINSACYSKTVCDLDVHSCSSALNACACVMSRAPCSANRSANGKCPEMHLISLQRHDEAHTECLLPMLTSQILQSSAVSWMLRYVVQALCPAQGVFCCRSYGNSTKNDALLHLHLRASNDTFDVIVVQLAKLQSMT